MQTNSHYASNILIQVNPLGREALPQRVPLINPRIPKVITLHAVATPTRKRRGEASEAAFLARATNLGFSVCIPWGDSERYDSVIGRGPRLLRVQVKSASRYAETRYRIRTTGSSYTIYNPAEIDFLVAHIVPEDLWYIIPIEAVGHRKGIRFYPHTRHPSRAHFERYREAWCLLACDPKARGRQDIPSVCRCKDLPHRCAVCPNCGTDQCGTDTPVRRL
ncbi:MAG: group I intron-associated PD-(D/E)XK endonuclease [Candidatus Sulfotelmatobacter sp.]